MMTKLSGWQFWRWVLLAAVALGLILLIWFGGPHLSIGGIAPFTTHTPRFLACLIVILLAGMVALAWVMRPKATTASALQERPVTLTSSASADAQQVPKAQRDAMERGFHLALAVLRRVRPPGLFSRSYRYALPWYVVIGRENVGKTAFLQASDLRFPLREGRDGRISAGPLNFSFTDRAVLVETRGPLVPQSETNTWSAFASLLKRHRNRQPLNGLVIALSLPEMVRASEVERFSFHADLRDQLEGFQRILKLRVPVYVVFTKADEVPGFREFCSDLTLAERRSAFGITLPLYDEHGMTSKQKPLGATFSAEYDHFIQWQLPRVIDQMKQAFSVEQRFECFMFLPHLATLKPMVADLVEDVFKPTTFERPLLLRGIYFTSSANVEPLGGNELLPPPGGTEAAADPRRMGYFIHDLLDKVIFKESGLVEADPATRRREAVLRGLATAACVGAGLCVLTWWVFSFIGNTYLIGDLQRATTRAQEVINGYLASAHAQSPSDTDLSAILPTLNVLEALPAGWASEDHETPLRLKGGLSQIPELRAVAVREYEQALQTLLQPRLQMILQNEIAGSMDRPAALYPALKVYLMLGRAGPMNKDDVNDWVGHYLAAAYPAPSQATMRTSLLRHVDNLIAAKLPPLELDEPLVSAARDALNAYSPANRGMTVLQRQPEIAQLQPWRLTDVAGPLAPFALARRSGRPLSEPIDGMYTTAAFFTNVIPAISKVAEEIVGEDWVRFPTTPNTPRAARVNQLRRDITDLYLNDYMVAWQNIISDVTIAPFSNLQEEMAVLQALLGPPSPLANYLNSAAKETTLAPPTSSVDSKLPALPAEVTALLNRSRALGDFVTAHFADLHRFVAGSPSPLDEILKSMGQLRSLIGPAASFGTENSAQVAELSTGPAYAQVLSQLKLNTLTAPPALTDSILGLVRQTSSITDQGVRADLDASWKTQVYPFCQQALNGRYPFANSPNEVTIADFTRMFAPDGLLDKFFDKQLKSFIDTQSTPWKPLTSAGAQPNIAPQTIAFFEQAARIRTYFFQSGSATPLFTFGVTPQELDPGASRVRLTIDGQSLTYQYGPLQTVQVQWPGNPGGVRVEFGANTMEQPVSQSFTGPWALFRFLAAQKLQKLTANRFNLMVNVGPRSAIFVVDAASVDNPFQRSPLPGFRCPPTLLR